MKIKEQTDFALIALSFSDVAIDPIHADGVLFSFALAPPAALDWQHLFLDTIWPLGRSTGTSEISASFPGPAILTLKCSLCDDTQRIRDRAKHAVKSTNHLYKTLFDNKRRETETRETTARGAAKERLSKHQKNTLVS